MIYDDFKKEVIPYLVKIGYIKHPHSDRLNNYLYESKDGYINILFEIDKYVKFTDKYIHFQKCFYKDINYDNVIDEKFRKVKLNNIKNDIGKI